jgi:hypothetical protein
MHRSGGNEKKSKSKRQLSLSGDVTVSAAVLAANDLMVSTPHPLCPVVCSRERSFVLIVIMLLVMIFTFHEMGRNSDLAWYPASMLSLSAAQSNQCVRTEGALATRPERSDAYWDSSVKALVELQGIAHDADAAARVEAAEALVVSVLRNCSDFCNVLVFGVSWDAILISEANWAGGATVFLEDDHQVGDGRPQEGALHGELCRSLPDPSQGLARSTRSPTTTKCSTCSSRTASSSTPWDVIIVRGPAGEPQRLGAFDKSGPPCSRSTPPRTSPASTFASRRAPTPSTCSSLTLIAWLRIALRIAFWAPTTLSARRATSRTLSCGAALRRTLSLAE